MPEIISLSLDLNDNSLKLVGGKGKGLYRLLCAGAKVPVTVCLPAGRNVEKAVEEILRYFNDSGQTKQYAVRSSASVEDLREKSFAGQFESHLRVSGKEELIKFIEKVRDLNNPENKNLKEYAGEIFGEIVVNVLVQEFIDADFAGVLFTCDPVSGSKNHIILEMVSGTAENLLSGTTLGQRYILSRKNSSIESDNLPALHREMIVKIVNQALTIEEKLKESPLDFEWAVKDGQIFWLQVRPVTAYGKRQTAKEEIVFIKQGVIPQTKEGQTHWTSINAREACPWVLSPLVSEILPLFVEAGFKEFAVMFGIAERDHYAYKTCGIFQGRVFLNITDLQKMMSHLPVENFDAIIEKFLTGTSAEQPKFKFSLSLVKPIFRMLWKDVNLEQTYNNFVKKEQQNCNYPHDDTLRKMEISEIRKKISELIEIADSFAIHLIGGMKYMNYYAAMEKICCHNNVNPSVFLQGLGTLLFASSAEYLRDLAFVLRGNEYRLFDENFQLKDDWKEVLNRAPKLNSFKKEFAEYIEKYGHLGDGSIDIYKKNYREEPEKILKLVADIMKQGEVINRQQYLLKLSQKRSLAIAELKKKLPFFERIKFTIVLKMMHSSAHFRENVKFMLGRRLAIIKVYLLEIARRFVQNGVLDLEEDIFFLKFDEVMTTNPSISDNLLKEKIKTRKLDYQKLLSLPCPLHRIESSDKSYLYFPDKGDARQRYSGIGASAGRVVGKARVILSLSEADRLQAGELLVTTATEPSWTPLFSVAGGVVVEIGSVLSHGAVVAREIGIPAVLGIHGIVEAVKDGDMLAVDGSCGTVEFVDD